MHNQITKSKLTQCPHCQETALHLTTLTGKQYGSCSPCNKTWRITQVPVVQPKGWRGKFCTFCKTTLYADSHDSDCYHETCNDCGKSYDPFSYTKHCPHKKRID